MLGQDLSSSQLHPPHSRQSQSKSKPVIFHLYSTQQRSGSKVVLDESEASKSCGGNPAQKSWGKSTSWRSALTNFCMIKKILILTGHLEQNQGLSDLTDVFPYLWLLSVYQFPSPDGNQHQKPHSNPNFPQLEKVSLPSSLMVWSLT